jgi:hypothetical protein
MKYTVILTSPTWSLSGVNTSSANLIHALCRHDIPAYLLITNQHQVESMPMPLPDDLPVKILPVKPKDTWEEKWDKLINHLEEMAPCIYIPGYDWDYSCISPKLSNNIGIIGVVHSDDPAHYDHVKRLGKYWNAIIAVSKTISDNTIAFDPSFAEKTKIISYGITLPEHKPPEKKQGNTLKIIYTGRVIE